MWSIFVNLETDIELRFCGRDIFFLIVAMTPSILLFKFHNLQKIKLVNQVQVMTQRDELRINRQTNKQTTTTTTTNNRKLPGWTVPALLASPCRRGTLVPSSSGDTLFNTVKNIICILSGKNILLIHIHPYGQQDSQALSTELFFTWVAPSMCCHLRLFLSWWRTSHFSLLNCMRLLPAHLSSLQRSLWMAARPSGESPFRPSSVLCHLTSVRMHSSPLPTS